MNGKYNVWCKWHPLKTVMLGQFYQKPFFENITNKDIKNALYRLTDETHEDLENFENILKQFGCNVIRPTIDPDLRIDHFFNDKGSVLGVVPRPPLQPRDAQLVIGDKLYYTNNDHPSIKQALTEYDPTYFDMHSDHQLLNNKNTWAPNFTVVGKDIYWDGFPINDEKTNLNFNILNETLHSFRWHQLTIGGHNDGCFHTIKNGAILSIDDVQTYSKTFPGWDVLFLKGESWAKVREFTNFKKKVQGSWWIPGEEQNDNLVYYINTWLSNWVGYVQESVFDVNVLVLDEHHICVSTYNKLVWDFLEKHKMTPILVPWRHRYFWDGGLHCITLDLFRDGVQEDYFPDREREVIDDIDRTTPRLKIY